VLITGIGAYLAWFGVHYFEDQRPDGSTLWPTDPVKAALTGKSVQTSRSPSAADISATAAVASNPATAGAAVGGPGVAAGGPAPAHSGAYDLPALETLWASQGGSGQTAWAAANIAMAESSGRPAVTSANPDGGINVGLWQLDTKGVGAGYTVAQLQDPATNARITIMHTANGTTWGPWHNPMVRNDVYVGPPV
jgi:hypothetical protein